MCTAQLSRNFVFQIRRSRTLPYMCLGFICIVQQENLSAFTAACKVSRLASLSGHARRRTRPTAVVLHPRSLFRPRPLTQASHHAGYSVCHSMRLQPSDCWLAEQWSLLSRLPSQSLRRLAPPPLLQAPPQLTLSRAWALAVGHTPVLRPCRPVALRQRTQLTQILVSRFVALHTNRSSLDTTRKISMCNCLDDWLRTPALEHCTTILSKTRSTRLLDQSLLRSFRSFSLVKVVWAVPRVRCQGLARHHHGTCECSSFYLIRHSACHEACPTS